MQFIKAAATTSLASHTGLEQENKLHPSCNVGVTERLKLMRHMSGHGWAYIRSCILRFHSNIGWPSSFLPVSGRGRSPAWSDKPVAIMSLTLCNTISFSLVSQNNQVYFSCPLIIAQRRGRDTASDKKDEVNGRQKQGDRQEWLGIDYWLLWSCQEAEETCSTAA